MDQIISGINNKYNITDATFFLNQYTLIASSCET